MPRLASHPPVPRLSGRSQVGRERQRGLPVQFCVHIAHGRMQRCLAMPGHGARSTRATLELGPKAAIAPAWARAPARARWMPSQTAVPRLTACICRCLPWSRCWTGTSGRHARLRSGFGEKQTRGQPPPTRGWPTWSRLSRAPSAAATRRLALLQWGQSSRSRAMTALIRRFWRQEWCQQFPGLGRAPATPGGCLRLPPCATCARQTKAGAKCTTKPCRRSSAGVCSGCRARRRPCARWSCGRSPGTRTAASWSQGRGRASCWHDWFTVTPAAALLRTPSARCALSPRMRRV
mmetsp:Transcript_7597/g.30077  ORF Transcript_7597/g.30077 Transcript_7597/m.30077 type:complete len:292 (-) Transcript_7597:259-1134(-)